MNLVITDTPNYPSHSCYSGLATFVHSVNGYDVARWVDGDLIVIYGALTWEFTWPSRQHTNLFWSQLPQEVKDHVVAMQAILQ